MGKRGPAPEGRRIHVHLPEDMIAEIEATDRGPDRAKQIRGLLADMLVLRGLARGYADARQITEGQAVRELVDAGLRQVPVELGHAGKS